MHHPLTGHAQDGFLYIGHPEQSPFSCTSCLFPSSMINVKLCHLGGRAPFKSFWRATLVAATFWPTLLAIPAFLA